jgi:hypothetical protein
VAKYVDQPVYLSTSTLSLGTCPHHTGIGDSSIGNIDSLTHVVDAQEDTYRYGPPADVSVPRR